MNDLIRRQMAIESIQDAGKIGKLSCIDILRKLPSEQLEIIRCQYCKYACIDPERESDEIYCSENDCYRWDDWFCGSAERREDE